MPEVQTEMTVRAFSGTLRRIFGGVDEELWDPLTFSVITADAARELDNRADEKYSFRTIKQLGEH